MPSTEYIFILKKEGKREITATQKIESSLDKEDWAKWMTGKWDIPSVNKNDDHPSKFPDELPRRLIKMFSCINDNILDPFLGSGTTIKIARELNRVGYGYEIENKYKSIIENNLKNT